MELTCASCKVKFDRPPCRKTERNFCSRKCMGDYQSAHHHAPFEDHFIKQEDGCWIWVKKQNSNGYGLYVTKGLYLLAHRVSWERYRGPISEGLHVCHTCDVRLCVNPDHLFLGTHSDNMIDCYQKGRHKRPELRDRCKHTGQFLPDARNQTERAEVVS